MSPWATNTKKVINIDNLTQVLVPPTTKLKQKFNSENVITNLESEVTVSYKNDNDEVQAEVRGNGVFLIGTSLFTLQKTTEDLSKISSPALIVPKGIIIDFINGKFPIKAVKEIEFVCKGKIILHKNTTIYLYGQIKCMLKENTEVKF
jgi:hypothetical protein